jgi:hypothetical protein
LPAFPGSGLIALAPVPAAFGVPPPMGTLLPPANTPIRMTVAQNTPETVIDLGPVFAGMRGIQHEDGLHYAILGNTNSRLVSTDLSGAALTLTCTRGQYGTATITVNATDADGVSVQRTFVVTVPPMSPPTVLGVPFIVPPPQGPLFFGPSW